MTETTDDGEAALLEQAVQLAVENVRNGGGPFGALIVENGTIIGRGVNRVTVDNDPTAHAEVVAIRDACKTRGDFRLNGCVLVTSCEPCPLCMSSALWARVDKVVYAADRHDAADGGFDDREFYELFAKDRADWHVPVVELSVPTKTAPFQEWLANPDRTHY